MAFLTVNPARVIPIDQLLTQVLCVHLYPDARIVPGPRRWGIQDIPYETTCQVGRGTGCPTAAGASEPIIFSNVIPDISNALLFLEI